MNTQLRPKGNLIGLISSNNKEGDIVTLQDLEGARTFLEPVANRNSFHVRNITPAIEEVESFSDEYYFLYTVGLSLERSVNEEFLLYNVKYPALLSRFFDYFLMVYRGRVVALVEPEEIYQ